MHLRSWVERHSRSYLTQPPYPPRVFRPPEIHCCEMSPASSLSPRCAPSCLGIVYADDRQIVDLRVRKTYGGGASGEVTMTVTTVPPIPAPNPAPQLRAMIDLTGEDVAAPPPPAIIDLTSGEDGPESTGCSAASAPSALSASSASSASSGRRRQGRSREDAITIPDSCIQCSLPHCGREALAAPYQCDHPICAACCARVGDTCPMCRSPGVPGW